MTNPLAAEKLWAAITSGKLNKATPKVKDQKTAAPVIDPWSTQSVALIVLKTTCTYCSHTTWAPQSLAFEQKDISAYNPSFRWRNATLKEVTAYRKGMRRLGVEPRTSEKIVERTVEACCLCVSDASQPFDTPSPLPPIEEKEHEHATSA